MRFDVLALVLLVGCEPSAHTPTPNPPASVEQKPPKLPMPGEIWWAYLPGSSLPWERKTLANFVFVRIYQTHGEWVGYEHVDMQGRVTGVPRDYYTLPLGAFIGPGQIFYNLHDVSPHL